MSYPQNFAPVKIEVEKTEKKGWLVRCGERWEDNLSPDECLWMVVMSMTGGNSHYLKNQEEHDAWNKKYGLNP